MIKKIVSGGQTGADRAALDVAIKFNIPHGGWIPNGRIAEDGSLSDNYHLQEMPTSSYPARTEQNVIDSDGTLIFSRGEPTGGTKYTRKMALKHKRKMLHIDLNIATSYDAASLILSWIKLHKLNTLNVAGPRTSKDGQMYGDVFRVLEIAYVMHKAQKLKSDSPPKTIEEAIDRLIKGLSLKDKATIANMEEIDLSTLHFNLGEYIRNHFGLWSGNDDLMTSCCFIVGKDNVDQDEASSIIIKELWKRLYETHKIRVIK
jgi:hypothetical protein